MVDCPCNGEEHLNKCKIALYIALQHKPANAYTDSDLDLMMILTEEPVIQNKLERARKDELDAKIQS